MRRYGNTILISVLLFIALIFSSCVPRVNLFTVEVVSKPDAISVALLKTSNRRIMKLQMSRKPR